MTKRYLSSLLILMLWGFGCAHRIDVQHYPFGSPMHHAQNGMDFLDMGLAQDAMREFVTALADNPTFSPALAGKGIYWAEEGQADVAVGYIILAERYASTPDEKVIAYLASMRVRLISNKKEITQDAARDFDEIVAITPNNDAAYYWMGMTLLKAGDMEGAEKKLKRVVELNGRYKRQAEKQLKEMKLSAPND